MNLILTSLQCFNAAVFARSLNSRLTSGPIATGRSATIFKLHMVRLAAILVLLFPVVLKAQNCVVNKNELTGKIIRSGTTQIVGDSSVAPTNFSIIKIDSSYTVSLIVHTGTWQNSGQSELVINFTSSKTVTLAATVQIMPGGSTVIINAPLPAKEATPLSTGQIAWITLNKGTPGGTELSIKLSALEADTVINSFRCLNAAN